MQMHERKMFYVMEKSEKIFLTDTLAKMSLNIFAYFSIPEHSASFSYFSEKTYILVTARGVCPPPYRFFDVSPMLL